MWRCCTSTKNSMNLYFPIENYYIKPWQDPFVTNYAIGFAGPMISLNTLKSIYNKQTIAWDNGAYSLSTETRSNELSKLVYVENETKKSVHFYDAWSRRHHLQYFHPDLPHLGKKLIVKNSIVPLSLKKQVDLLALGNTWMYM